jgi:hypothetical protein
VKDLEPDDHDHLGATGRWRQARPSTKRAVKTFTWSTLTAIVVTLGGVIAIWQGAGRSLLVAALAEEAAEQASANLDKRISEAVQAQVAPVERKVNASNAGLKAIIRGNIAGLEADVNRLEYLRDYRTSEWNDERRRELFDKQRALTTQRQALADIVEAEQAPLPTRGHP